MAEESKMLDASGSGDEAERERTLVASQTEVEEVRATLGGRD
jgi:hypothetical protein